MLAAKLFGFLFGPGGRILLAVLALTAWTIYQRADATSDCKEAQLRVELEEANRKLREAALIYQRAEARAKESADALEQVERQKDEILLELQASDTSCPLSDSAIERLRSIR